MIEAGIKPPRFPMSRCERGELAKVHVSTRMGDWFYCDVHRKMSATPAQANRALALLSKMFNLAIQWELRTDNPVRGLQRYAEQPRERYLDGPELKRLSVALSQHPNATIVNAIRLQLLTGARRSEVLNATWSQFDLDSGVWVKPSSHTKQKRSLRWLSSWAP